LFAELLSFEFVCTIIISRNFWAHPLFSFFFLFCLSGYLLEESLSVDNLFVFLLLFDYFKVPAKEQKKVSFSPLLFFFSFPFSTSFDVPGCLLEKSITVGNLGVLLPLFAHFKVPQKEQDNVSRIPPPLPLVCLQNCDQSADCFCKSQKLSLFLPCPPPPLFAGIIVIS